jgi:hypothetical protein
LTRNLYSISSTILKRGLSLQGRTKSEERIKAMFRKAGLEKVEEIIERIESSPKRKVVVNNLRINTKQGLHLANKVKGELIREFLDPQDHRDMVPFEKKLKLTDLNSLTIPLLPVPIPPAPWNCISADQLVATCPFEQEIQQIRSDFNIYFDKGLIDHGVLQPWNCTNNGGESSIMLSMYNIFRLTKCIPFDTSFPWSTSHSNLYVWLKSLNLPAIGFFWADPGVPSHARGNRIFLAGNQLADPIFREIINPQTGMGIIFYVTLLAHEARHAGYNIGHNCETDKKKKYFSKDTNLAYMGAWAVQYYLLNMLADNTGDFFTDYQKNQFRGSAQDILTTRFCDNPP